MAKETLLEVKNLVTEFRTEDETVKAVNDISFTLSKGETYIVSDELSSHRSVTESGVKLLIIDGDFLK